MRQSLRRGYTLIEAAVTLFLLSVITATSVFMIGASSSTGSDAVAQSSADAAMDAMVSTLAQDGSLTSDPVPRLSAQYPSLTFINSSTASTSSSSVSVAVSSGVAAVAVSGSSGACWMLRLDMSSGDSNHIRRYVLVPEGSNRTCTASAAMGTDVLSADGTRGSSWSRPLVWSESSTQILSNALVYLRADSLSQDQQRMRNEGTGGPSLDGTLGTSQSPDALDPVVLQHNGSDYLYIPGIGNRATTPDSSWLDLTGNLSLTANVKPNDWTPSSAQALIAKYSPSAGSMSYALLLRPDGTLSARWSKASATGSNIEAVSTSSVTFQDSQQGWVRAKMEVSGADTTVSFWVSSDGTSWSQLGSSASVLSSAPFTTSSEPLVVGSLSDGSYPYTGSVFRAEVRSSQGALVAQFNPSACDATAQSCTGATGEVWSVTRSSGSLRATVVSRDSLLFGDSLVSLPDTAALDLTGTSYITVLARLRLFDDTAESVLFGKFAASDADTRGYGVKVGSAGTVYGFASLNNTAGGLTQTPLSVSSGQYVTVVLRVEPVLSKVQMWIDQASSQSSAGIPSPWVTLENSHFFAIGGSRTSSAVSANTSMELSALAVFDRSLTQEEINRAYSEISR